MVKHLKPVTIHATDLNDAWFQGLWNLMWHGQIFTIDRGSYAGQERLELDFVTLHVTHPSTRPLLPVIPPTVDIPAPVADDYLDTYMPKIMTAYKEPGEQYTYGERLSGYSLGASQFDRFGCPVNKVVLNQIETVIQAYKAHGPRNNQMVLRVCQPSDILLEDPPCLCHIDTRIQDGRLHFMPYFRSWDAWGGLPANLAGITLLMEYMAAEIGVESGEIIATSKGLHLYGYAIEYARRRCGRSL